MNHDSAINPNRHDVLSTFNWDHDSQHWTELLEAGPSLSTLELVNRWSELEKYIYEVAALLRWNHHRDEKDPEHKQRLSDYNQKVLPEIILLRSRVAELVQQRNLDELPAHFSRALKLVLQKSSIESKLGELLAEEKRLLSQRFKHEPVFSPEEQDLLDRFVEIATTEDEGVRKETKVRQIALKTSGWEQQGKVFIELLRLRRNMAQQAGVDSYEKLAWVSRSLSEYSREEYRTFREMIREKVVPLLVKVQAIKSNMIGKSNWEVWDFMHPEFVKVDYHPLTTADVQERTPLILASIHPDMKMVFEQLLASGHLDMGDHGYLYANQLPLSKGTLVMASFSHELISIRDLFHEIGHAYQYSLALAQDLFWNRWCDYKMGETTSLFLDFATFDKFPEFGLVSEEHVSLARLLMLEDNLFFTLSNAFHDAFQEQVYKLDPDTITLEDLRNLSRGLAEQYFPYVTNLPSFSEWMWLNNYTFSQPFLQLEYTVAFVVAMGRYNAYLQDPQNTVSSLFGVHKLGGSVSYLEAIQLCGSGFTFDEKNITMSLQDVEAFVEHFIPAAFTGGS